MKRAPITKRTRFSIFSRDDFKCRYCGRQSDEVTLVIDHIIPVCKGGTNDAANLITACNDCNAGKGGEKINQVVPNEQDRLRLLQEMREQKELAEAVASLAESEESIKQDLINYFCKARNTEECDGRTLDVLRSYARSFGVDVVFGWIDIAVSKFNADYYSDVKIGRYISGIRKQYEQKLLEQRIHQPTGYEI